MSKKRYRKQTKNFPWLLVGLGGVLLLVAALFFANQNGGGTPAVEVDQQQIDFGYVKLEEPRSFAIRVTNRGDGTLRFQAEPYIEIVEGC